MVRSSHAQTARSAGAALVLGGLLSLIVAGAMYYVTWWRADPFIYLTFMTRMPLEVSPEFAANPFGITSAPKPPAEDAVETAAEPSAEEVFVPRWQGKTAQVLIPATAYGWLVLATSSACAVALAGGAWLGLAGGKWVRVLGVVGVLGLVGGVGFFAYRIWTQSQMMFKPDQLRVGMGFLALLLALMGLTGAGRARGITKFAGVVVILAAVATAAAIWLWAQSGALDLHYAAWPKLAAAFGIHAVWGVVLLVCAKRIRA